jgi:diguanylate cyclase (GGDEF)-like protein
MQTTVIDGTTIGLAAALIGGAGTIGYCFGFVRAHRRRRTPLQIPVTAAVPPARPGLPVRSQGFQATQREVFALYEIAQTLGSSLRLTDVLDLVVTKIALLVPFRTCVVYQQMKEGGLHARYVAGANAGSLRGRRTPPGEGITGWVAQNRMSALSETPALDLEGSGIDPVPYGSVAAFPLLHRDELLGVITLFFPATSPCDDDHRRVMDIVARLLSGAMHEGRLAEGEEGDNGLVDPVTHLPSEKHLGQAFEKAVLHCQQSGQPLGLVEMDLDDFTAINEQAGREAGDRFLMEVGRVLRSHLRERDVLVRLEEDRFGALLPGTGFAAAALLTERLQQAVDSFALKLEDGAAVYAGLSVGIALYPADGETIEELMQRASLNRTRNKHGRKLARAASPNVVPFRSAR